MALHLIVSVGLAGAEDLTPKEQLGKYLFFDRDLSQPAGQACASCHAPEVGFTGPDPQINAHGAVIPGAVSRFSGFRKPPTIAYARFIPHAHAHDGIFGGGLFWDGRAANLLEQLRVPVTGEGEMHNPGPKQVVLKVREASYAPLFEAVYGRGSLKQKDEDRTFALIAEAIVEYEKSSEVSPFSSKYDAFLAGWPVLTPTELWGLDLFEGIARCNTCHPNRPEGFNDPHPPLFTTFRYVNLGLPRNPENPYYDQPPSINPAREAFVDLGLGVVLNDRNQDGKVRIPTLRNVDKRPDPDFVKAYMHNGVLKSLEDVVHFYNARDVDLFPDPEVPDNVVRLDFNGDGQADPGNIGNIGLTEAEEDALVAFLKTLSDGYSR